MKASGPQVDMMQGHERRWIPDPQTFNYMGLNWGAIQIIPDGSWNAIPAGPQFPSRTDGTLLKGSGPAIYVMQNGQRHWIPDPATFNAMGYNWSAVQNVADSDLIAIPLGSQVPEGGTVRPAFPIVASQDDNFPGSGGFMHTDASVYSSGLLKAVTHTWEVTDLRGFRGAVAVALLDQNENALWVSATQHFGVDGRWMGTSDRTDNWSDNAPAAILPIVRYIAIIQKWDPNNVFNDIQAWLGGTASVANELGPIIQAVVKIVAAL
ncbi:MAG: hypothetical protein WBC04_17820 [Candidatus Acidiferrales bacterium]